jgi:hypothetical protein
LDVTILKISAVVKIQLKHSIKVAFNKKKTLSTSKLDLNLRKKLVKCYIWSTAFYGAETWTQQIRNTWKVSFELLCWRRME